MEKAILVLEQEIEKLRDEYFDLGYGDEAKKCEIDQDIQDLKLAVEKLKTT